MRTNHMRALEPTWIFTASGPVMKDHALIIEGEQIVDLLPREEARKKYQHLTPETLEGCTVMPGFVNCHSHTILSGDGSAIEAISEYSDERLLLQAQTNVLRSLAAGVTTLTDLGGRNDVTFELRDAIRAGSTLGPRLLLAGQPFTSHRGHCWQMNGDVRGEVAIRQRARQLFARGADLLKVMATGGGTEGTDPYRPQFCPSELEVMVEEACGAGKPSFAHCSATSAVRQALKAGFNVIVHGTFHDEAGVLTGWDDESVELALEHKAYWNPTLAVARGGILFLQRDPNADQQVIDKKRRVWEERAEGVRRMSEAGIPILSGSDEGWSSYTFGGFLLELEALVDAGFSSEEALLSATVNPAKALRVSDQVGSLAVGMSADLLVVEGMPFEQLEALKSIRQVILAGENIDLGPAFVPPVYR